jgi:hypothetical protein
MGTLGTTQGTLHKTCGMKLGNTFKNHVLYQNVITNNERLVCLHAKEIRKKTDAFGFQTRNKHSVHCNSSKWIISCSIRTFINCMF